MCRLLLSIFSTDVQTQQNTTSSLHHLTLHSEQKLTLQLASKSIFFCKKHSVFSSKLLLHESLITND